MKLSVLALDYDGTIARNDQVEPSVRRAIAEARARGIVVMLVTGRILSELRRVAGDLHFVDAVVAENGAILHVPDSGHTSTLAPRVSAEFARTLAADGIRFSTGDCLIDADASDAGRLLHSIRASEAPLVLAFNRSRVMVLPQGVSKATGLHAALDMLRLSARNMLAIGDAENDHELLRLAEVGVAVEWGSESLKTAADTVLSGHGPADVGSFVGTVICQGAMPAPSRFRRRLLLGYGEDGQELSLAVRGRNVLIAGDAKSGKSWIAGLLCEQLILHGYSVCVLDPEGDYRTLEALPGVAVLGGEDPPPSPRELLRALRYPDRSVVIDLSRQTQDAKIEYVRAALPALAAMRRRTGLPHRIVLDEAHYFLHDDAAVRLLDLEANGYTIVTYRASHLPPALLAASEVVVVACESDPVEVEALRRLCPGCADADPVAWRATLGRLGAGQAAILPITQEAAGGLCTLNLTGRLTPHVRHRAKYVDVPVGDSRAFVFGADGHRDALRAHTLREFVGALEQGDAAVLDGYLHRGDFSRWIGDVFGDRALAAELRVSEQRHRTGVETETIPEMIAAIRARYDLTLEEAPE